MVEQLKKLLSKYIDVLKYLLVIVVIAIISFLFPKQAHQAVDLQVGERWNFDELIASESFPVSKTSNQIASEKNEIEENFIQIFDIREDLKISQLNNLRKNLEQFFTSIDENSIEQQLFVDNVIDLVDSIFTQGIYKPVNDISQQIRVANNGDYRIRLLSDLLTESEAENKARDWLEQNYQSYYNTVFGYMNQAIVPNILYNKELSETKLNESVNNLNKIAFTVQRGEVIISKGDILDDNTNRKLKAYQKLTKSKLFSSGLNLSTFLGYFLLTCLIIGALLLYILFHFPEIFENFNKLAFLLMWPVIFSLLVYSVESTENLSSFIIPFCIVPIVVKNFFNERLALFVHIVIVLIASFLSKLGYEFTFILILTGIVTVLTVSETRYWNKFFNAILIIFLTYVLSYFGLALIKAENIAGLDWGTFVWLGFAAILTLLAYPFIPLLERLFGFTSSITLAELSDMNRPLIKQMSIEAPGTLQHSLQVSNLAEAAADKIGANYLLVKVAALYHDIGKLKHPQYFIENQSGMNPHESISYFESARKIIEHVTEGEKMAKKAKLPQIIIDFIVTHHGTTRVEYFYRKQLTEYPDREFDQSLFQYPGPKPHSKEEAIMMLADSLEASSKSLKNPTGQDIDALVDNITDQKIKLNQLDESHLSFVELEQCKEVFKSLLRSINHVRIEYPEEVNKEIQNDLEEE